MKKRMLVLSFVVALMTQFSFAINSVNNTLPGNGVAVPVELLSSHALTKAEAKAIQKAEKKQVRTHKRIAVVHKFLAKNMAKKAIDFQDPVNKWLWFAIFGFGAAILLYILAAAIGGGFYWLGYLASLFGTVAIIIWLVKKFGNA